MHAGFGLSPAAELSDRPEETLIIDCADSAEVSKEPPALKKRKRLSGVLTKPNDSAAKGAIPSQRSQIYQLLGCGSTISCHPVLIATSGLCVVCQKI